MLEEIAYDFDFASNKCTRFVGLEYATKRAVLTKWR